MPAWLSEDEYAALEAACERLIPATDRGPGAAVAGVAGYIDQLLGAFTFDPPRIWAGGPSSGRHGGSEPASPGSTGCRPSTSWPGGPGSRVRRAGPSASSTARWSGWQERYREGLAALGSDFRDLDGAAQDARLRADPDFCDLLYTHACEGMYGAPEYGGNRGLVGWRAIGFEGDVQPRGWTDEEVTRP